MAEKPSAGPSTPIARSHSLEHTARMLGDFLQRWEAEADSHRVFEAAHHLMDELEGKSLVFLWMHRYEGQEWTHLGSGLMDALHWTEVAREKGLSPGMHFSSELGGSGKPCEEALLSLADGCVSRPCPQWAAHVSISRDASQVLLMARTGKGPSATSKRRFDTLAGMLLPSLSLLLRTTKEREAKSFQQMGGFDSWLLLPLPCFLVSVQGEIANLNPAAKELLSKLKPGLGPGFHGRMGQDATWWEHLVSSIEENPQTGAGEFTHGPSTFTFWALPSKDSESLLLILNDVTERRKRLYHQMHESVIASVGFLSAGLAHEFRNILASLDGRAQIAIYKNDLENYRKLVQLVREQARRGAILIKGLMSFSSSLRFKRKEHISLDLLVRQAVGMVEKELNKSGISLELELEERIFCHVYSGEIQQVVLNLVQNASESLEGGGIIRILLDKLERRARIRIVDNGRGISENDVEKVFQPFFTTKGLGGALPQQGAGLGMTLALNCVKQHRGNLELQSKVGKGTTVTILLPIA